MMKQLLFWVVGVMCVMCAWADAELTLADVQRGPHTYSVVGGYDHGKMYRFINASEIEKEINK